MGRAFAGAFRWNKFVCVFQWLKNFSLFNFPASALRSLLWKHSRFHGFPKRGIHEMSFSCSMKLTWIMTNFAAAHIFRKIIYKYIFTIFPSHTYHETKSGHLKNEIYFVAAWTTESFFFAPFGEENLHLKSFLFLLLKENEDFSALIDKRHTYDLLHLWIFLK